MADVSFLKVRVVIFCGLLAGGGLAGCRNDLKEVDKLTARRLPEEDHAQGVTIIYSTNGKVSSRLSAPDFVRAEKARPPYTDASKGVKIEVYDSTLTVQTTVTAKYARWYEQQGNVLLRDSVRISNIKGERLETEELVWNESTKKFFTEKPVHIVTPTQDLRGTGMEANQDFSEYNIKFLQGKVNVEKGQLPE